MRKILKTVYQRYLVDAMSAMALGLFSSLIIGLILEQMAKIPFLSFLATYTNVVNARSPVVGAAIGVAIAAGLKADKLALFSSAVAGAVG
ncbi:MAG: PTS sugar transporter subunit IIC, partial [Clostridiales bacterium]|nr:PTS sugar transporter subunit IIC [Clostridiales bacterium]